MAIPLPTPGFKAAYRAGRATTPGRRRTPVLAHIGRAAAHAANHAAKLRTAALSVGGLGLIDAAAFQVHTAAGLAATGLSLLVLEYLSGGDG